MSSATVNVKGWTGNIFKTPAAEARPMCGNPVHKMRDKVASRRFGIRALAFTECLDSFLDTECRQHTCNMVHPDRLSTHSHVNGFPSRMSISNTRCICLRTTVATFGTVAATPCAARLVTPRPSIPHGKMNSVSKYDKSGHTLRAKPCVVIQRLAVTPVWTGSRHTDSQIIQPQEQSTIIF